MFNIKDYLKKIDCPCNLKDSFKFLKLSNITFPYNIRQTTFILEKSE
jgi:hypothetical protein